MNMDRLATVLGGLMAAITAANIDFAKLAAGDRAELSKAFTAVLMAVFGLVTNKK